MRLIKPSFSIWDQQEGLEGVYKQIEKVGRVCYKSEDKITEAIDYKIGLPKLPANFPPVPQDLNELIALKKGISVSEAFGLDREEIASGIHSSILCSGGIVAEDGIHPDKFNALWDAKVTKSIWERLQ